MKLSLFIAAVCFSAGVGVGVLISSLWGRSVPSTRPAAIAAGAARLPVATTAAAEAVPVPSLAARVAIDPRSRALFLWAMSRIDPSAALAELSSLDSATAAGFRERIVSEWVQRSPESACAYIFANEKSSIPTNGFGAAIVSSGRYDLAEAALTHIETDYDKRVYLDETSEAWPLADASQLGALLSRVSDPPSRSNIFISALQNWATEDFGKAEQFLSENAKTAEDRTTGNGALMAALANSGRLQAALTWLDAQTESAELDDARNVLAPALAGYDPDRALELLGRNKSSVSTSFAIGMTLRKLDKDVPGSVMFGLLELSTHLPPEARERNIVDSFSRWYSQDPDAAMEYVRANDRIPAELCDTLLNSVSAKPR